MLLRLFHPPAVGHVVKFGKHTRHGGGGLGMGLGSRVAADIAHDEIQPLRVNMRANVVKGDAQQPILGPFGQPQCIQPPARGAKHGGLIDAKMIQQFQRITTFNRGGIV